MKNSSWKEYLERERKHKNIFLAIHPQSPIPTLERKSFKGLNYYPPNIQYRFEVKLHEYSEKKTIRMVTTHGEEQEYIRWGKFRFKLDGKEQTLQLYKRNPKAERMFIPFRDATSGKETYGAGRYLDLELKKHYNSEGMWILDFNEAYNPFCAYSEAYTCPLVPPENWLTMPVCAGEKIYAPEGKHKN